MSSYYPENEKSLYYVEFGRGGQEYEFTIFRRHFMYSEKELNNLKEKNPDHTLYLEITNEVHPWNIFTSDFGHDGCVPDRAWVCWMVDALNEKAKNEN
jgi:hypothetical protein